MVDNLEGYICSNCHKLTFGECVICHNKAICKVDGCNNKLYNFIPQLCEKHYKNGLKNQKGNHE